MMKTALWLTSMWLVANAGFVCYTASAGLDVYCSTSGVQVGDVNGDGLFDLLFTTRDHGVKTFIADSPFHFEETDLGLPTSGYTRGGTLLDIDNDGDLDYFVAFLYSPSLLFRNDGDYFSDITDTWNFEVLNQGEGTACLDFNNDGRLDPFVGRYHASKKLFRNEGTSLVDVTDSTCLGTISDGNDLPSVVDLDNDGLTDISVSANENYIRLVHNDGGGSFSHTVLTTGDITGGHDWGDFDNDGDLDLAIVTNGRPRVFRNDGGSFTEVGEELGIETASSGLGGCSWGDFDNDGWLDLLITQTSGSFLYRNLSGELFVDVTESEGLSDIGSVCGAAWADFDEDGLLDIAVARWYDEPKSIFRNERSNGNSWIEIDLVGVASPANPVGTSVTVVVRGRRFTRLVGSNHGYASQNPYRLHFGLGRTASSPIDSIIVRWTSGVMSIACNVLPNQVVTLFEEATGITSDTPLDPAVSQALTDVRMLELFDLFGRRIGTFRDASTPLNNLPAGVYLFRLRDRNGNTHNSKRIIIR